MKMIKKTAMLAVCALLICSMLCGCGASAKGDSYEMYSSSANGSFDREEYGIVGDMYDAAEPESAAGAGEVEFERKIIRNADLSVEAEDARECYRQMLEFASSVGGYESYCSINSNETSANYRYVNINASIKLPPEQLDAFLAKAGELGTVTHVETTTDEITAEYYDVALRLGTAREQLDTYYGLLDTAETIDDVLSIQTRIDQLVSDIEYYEGMIRYYDSMVDESTVTLYIHQDIDVPVAEDDFEWDSLGAKDVLMLIKNGFLGVLNFLWSALLWIVIIVISALPLIAIGAVVFVCVRAWRRKHPKKKKAPAPVYYVPAQPTVQPTAGGEEKK